MKKIKRKCIVCGKNLTINLGKNGHYDNGRYFGKIKLTIKGTGEYKKIGTAKPLGKSVNIVKWTGKKRKIEDWECNKCYEESMHESWLENIIEKLYGKKCKDYEDGCGCCRAWGVFDIIIEENRSRL